MIVYGLYFDSQPYRQELAEHLVQLKMVDSISRETVRQELKKNGLSLG